MVRNTYILSAHALHADLRRHHSVHVAGDAEVQLDLISGYHMQETGATSDLELAFT
jgi:methylmalonyl-CoA mutase N-terminal domain/subunit